MGFERVGDGSGASIAADLGPVSLLLGEGEACENPFTRVLPQTSIDLKPCVDDIYISNGVPFRKGLKGEE